jgi:hypothetical protein
MAGKNTAAFAIFPTRAAAESAVDRLVAAGFSNQDVSVLMSDNDSSRDFATEKNTKAPEGTTTGVGVGGVIGGTLGLLAGIGALAIPGVGPFIAAGPIMGALAGLGVGGAVGGLVGALVGLGIPEYEAKRYEGRVKDGGILVSVHCDSSDEVSRAKDVLKQSGGEDIASSGEKAVSTHTDNTGTGDRYTPDGTQYDADRTANARNTYANDTTTYRDVNNNELVDDRTVTDRTVNDDLITRNR